MAELCYSGWYMGFSVRFPIISLGKNVMAWSHSQEQGKLVLECWRFMWVYSTTSTWGSKVTCQSRQLFTFASCFSSELVTHGFFLLVPLWQELWVLTRWEFFHVSGYPCSGGRVHKFSNFAAGDKGMEAQMWKVSQERTVSLWLLNLLWNRILFYQVS